MNTPGTNAKVVNQSATIGLKCSLPRASWPTLKKAYAAMPARNRPTPTGMVPSGSGAREEVEGEVSDTNGQASWIVVCKV